MDGKSETSTMVEKKVRVQHSQPENVSSDDDSDGGVSSDDDSDSDSLIADTISKVICGWCYKFFSDGLSLRSDKHNGSYFCSFACVTAFNRFA
jgi:hypothetical protein